LDRFLDSHKSDFECDIGSLPERQCDQEKSMTHRWETQVMTGKNERLHDKLTESELEFIRQAHTFLEEPSFLIRIANSIGKPVEGAMRLIPQEKKQIIDIAVQTALNRGLAIVRSSLERSPKKTFDEAREQSRKSGILHSLAAFGTGAGGGFFGIASLPIELPITTGIMLRSISAIADEFGMDLDDPKIQLDCLYVLSLGSPKSDKDDAMDSAYWTSRIAFARLVNDAAREIQRSSTPALLRFLAQVAARYNVVVSQKAMAQLVPAIGAIGGGAINAAFTDYFSDAARYHFGLKALEKKYGSDAVQTAYQRIQQLENV
jgi:hypothetical protein